MDFEILDDDSTINQKSQTQNLHQRKQSENNTKCSKIFDLVINQTGNLLGVCTQKGFRIYNKITFCNDKQCQKNIIIRETPDFILNRGVRTLSFLYDTLIMGLVLEDEDLNSKVIIWDEKNNQQLQEIEFYQEIQTVNYMRDILFVTSQERAVLYDLKKDQPLRYILSNTINNPGNKLNFQVGQNYDQIGYAYQNKQNLIEFRSIRDHNIEFTFKISTSKKLQVQCCKLNYDSTLLVCVDQTGQIIEVYNTITGNLEHSFNRGNGKKKICSIEFSRDNKILAIIGYIEEEEKKDQATLYIFKLDQDQEQNNKKCQQKEVFKKYNFNMWKEEEKDQTCYKNQSKKEYIGPQIWILQGDSDKKQYNLKENSKNLNQIGFIENMNLSDCSDEEQNENSINENEIYQICILSVTDFYLQIELDVNQQKQTQQQETNNNALNNLNKFADKFKNTLFNKSSSSTSQIFVENLTDGIKQHWI